MDSLEEEYKGSEQKNNRARGKDEILWSRRIVFLSFSLNCNRFVIVKQEIEDNEGSNAQCPHLDFTKKF